MRAGERPLSIAYWRLSRMPTKYSFHNNDPQPASTPRLSTGIAGLDTVLRGGLTPNRLYLLEGTPGTGKTTVALQFLRAGVARGDRCLYITLSETQQELVAAAATHDWSLDGIDVYELVNEAGLDLDSGQSVLHPADMELNETTRNVMARVEELGPALIVFDSLSEMRLLAQSPLRYRRQILALKHFFANRECTVLLLDDKTSEPGDLQLHSIAHGVMSLDQYVQEFGPERRRVRVIKMRGIQFDGGYHDIRLERGGMIVYPRLVAAQHHNDFVSDPLSTGVPALDELIGGGLVPGTNTLLSGPSGAGKTTTAIRCVMTALQRGERVVYYLFDEGVGTLLTRSKLLGMDLQPYLDSGALEMRQVDPAELSPGEFSSAVRHAVESDGARMLVIDSLNAYIQAMPGERFLMLHMHELLAYLNQRGVTTILILGQHGFIGEIRSDIDLSYLSDAVLLFRFFEAKGEILTAISALKSRTSAHGRMIREFRVTPGAGIRIGEALTDFEGVLSGVPTYRGSVALLDPDISDNN